jgi:hypothetical protein
MGAESTVYKVMQASACSNIYTMDYAESACLNRIGRFDASSCSSLATFTGRRCFLLIRIDDHGATYFDGQEQPSVENYLLASSW